MLKRILVAFAAVFPLLVVIGYAVFLLCITSPISVLSIEKAGQFGDSFGVITCLFSGLAFSGVLVTVYLQRQAMTRSENEHSQNTKLMALAALLSVYHELADRKQAELLKFLALPRAPGDTGQVESALQRELDSIQEMRDSITVALERAAGLSA